MNGSLLKFLRNLYVGSLNVSNERKRKVFFSGVFVHNSIIDDFLNSEKLLLTGPKGSGKTRVFFYLQDNPDRVVRDENDEECNISCTFLDFARPYRRSRAKFKEIIKDINDKSLDKGISRLEAYGTINKDIVETHFHHVIAHQVLKGIERIMIEREIKILEYPELNDYMATYGIKKSQKFLDRVLNVGERITSKKLKLKLKVCEAEVSEDDEFLDPEDVLKESDIFLRKKNIVLCVIIDNPELIGDISDEPAVICLLQTFFLLATGWNDEFSNIYLKILTRADLPFRGYYYGKDKMMDVYLPYTWDKDQFIILILKRLLFSASARKVIDYTGDIADINSQGSEELVKIFQKFFGRLEYDLPPCSIHFGKRKDYESKKKFELHEFLFLYFSDGKGSMPVRFIIYFLQMCRKIEMKSIQERGTEKTDSDNIFTAENPLFSESTIKRVMFDLIPQMVIGTLDEEYFFTRRDLYSLLGTLCSRDFDRKELLDVLESIPPDAVHGVDIVDTTFKGLFYSGIIGGDKLLHTKCKRFYLPAFVQMALKHGSTTEGFQEHGTR